MTNEELKKNIVSLEPLEKIHLIEDILDTLDIPDPDIEKKWVEESEKRYEAYMKGLTKGITLEEFEKSLKI